MLLLPYKCARLTSVVVYAQKRREVVCFPEIKKITFRVLYTLNLNCLEGHEVFFYSICYMITTTLKQKSLLDLIYIFTRAYWYWYLSLSSTISRSFFHIVAFSLIIHARRGDVSLSSLSLTTASKATGFGFLLLVCSPRLVSFFRSCWRCSRRRRRWWCCCCWDEAVGFVVETFV